ncbi:hypothetical protein VTK56DRAFT_4977 [Thermocarpiscus australiensis]
MEDIDYDRSVLSNYLALMAVDRLALWPSTRSAAPRRLIPPSQDQAGASRSSSLTPTTQSGTRSPRPWSSSSASYRSREGGDWRISEAHSAGFFVKNASNCADVIDRLQYSGESAQKAWGFGSKNPDAIPLAARLRQQVLKQAIRKQAGASAAVPRGKGRVLQLGTFLPRRQGVPREILYPRLKPDGSWNRHKWNSKVAEIETALKEFLKQEMDWRPPGNKQ